MASIVQTLACLLMAVFASTSLGQVPGGYSKRSTTDDVVVAAAKFAVETQSKKEPVTLVKVLAAESQIVAGTNIRLTLEVRTKDGEKQAVVVVWNKLGGAQELTEWELKMGAPPKRK